MTKQQFPNGWNQIRIQALLNHLSQLTEEEQVAKDETALARRVFPIEIVAERVRSALSTAGEQNSCILAAKALIEALHLLGQKSAFPLSVKTTVYNDYFAKKINEVGLPSNEKQFTQWAEEGGRLIMLGHGKDSPDSTKWPGHLVVMVPLADAEKHYLIDLTLSQAHKPEWRINLNSLLLKVPSAFVNGSRDALLTKNGCLIHYKARIEDHSYESTGNWSKPEYAQGIVDHALRLLESIE